MKRLRRRPPKDQLDLHEMRMKWRPFIILAVLTLICQTTIVPVMAIYSVWPNWMFILAVHYALWGPWPDAAIGAWVLGFGVDLQTVGAAGHIGLYAFLFGGTAWAIIRIRKIFFRDHALTQVLVTGVFALVVELAVEIYRQWGSEASKASFFLPALFTALYTAAWAPYLHWLLARLRRWTGLNPASKR